jgi:NADH:ubiquinone oxidoreductase subunit E
MTGITDLIKQLVDVHGRSRKSLLPILQGIVHQEHFLSDYALTEVARELDLSAAQVYGTATFYSFLDTQPRGKYVIRVCKTITCEMNGKNQVIKAIEDTLKIKLGETTPNNLFSLLQTNCLGLCHKGPTMLINDTPYDELSAEKVVDILTDIMKKQPNPKY